MAIFSPKNNTISDKQAEDLRRKAQKANTRSMFDRAEVERRKANNKQQSKSRWS